MFLWARESNDLMKVSDIWGVPLTQTFCGFSWVTVCSMNSASHRLGFGFSLPKRVVSLKVSMLWCWQNRSRASHRSRPILWSCEANVQNKWKRILDSGKSGFPSFFDKAQRVRLATKSMKVRIPVPAANATKLFWPLRSSSRNKPLPMGPITLYLWEAILSSKNLKLSPVFDW